MSGINRKKYLASELSPFEEFRKGWSQLLAWVYANSYGVGMSNVGYQWLYGELRGHQHLLVERFFDFPGEPASLESGRPLAEFPVIAVSIPFELDGLNFLGMLARAGIPLFSEKRGRTPIVIAGGDAVTLNPAPWAPFFDALFLGDGESFAAEFPKILANSPPGMVEKDSFLEATSRIPGCYVPPGKLQPPAKSRPENPCYSPILTSFGHFRNMFLVEIQRGCAFKCAFCASSWLGDPFHNFSAESVLRVYDDFGQSASRAGLVGSAISEHPALEGLLDGFAERNVRVNLSSLRLDRISERLLDRLSADGARTLTFAPETASPELARKIGKWIPPEKIANILPTLENSGIRELKLYWIIGLPGENESDLRAIANALELLRERSNIPITCSVNPFIPKPHTRFSDEQMLPHSELKRRFKVLKSEVEGIEGVSLEVNYSRRTRLSALLSNAGRHLSPALAEIALGGGIRFTLKKYGFDIDAAIGG